jgi:TonB-linked SusC/RagA family outer membrane protein
MKRILTVFGVLLLFIGMSFAAFSQQRRQITGTVLSSDGVPVKFATIKINGAVQGTSADEQGVFKIDVTDNATLQISAVGYETSTVKVGKSNTLVITLISAGNSLGEVVVTALGISRAKKTLGYAVQELNNSALTDAADNNIVNSISGKIAGAQVTSGGSTIGASSRIVIRGNASFAGNQPLFVVDGTPIDNSTTNLDGGGGIDWGNTASDLDPNDIESMTVLKGANAAALYGSRATNGVILVTTKKGSKNKGLGVDLNSSVVINTPGYWPKFQNEYGGGWDGEEYIYKQFLANNPGSTLTYNEYAKQYSYNYVDGSGGGVNDAWPINWGPRLDAGLKLDQWSTGANSPWVSRPDNYKNFYSTELTTVNSVAVSAGGEKASGRFSYTNQNTPTGILPNTDQKQNTINTSFSLNPTDKLSVVANITYLVKHSDNIPINGYTGVGVDFAWTERDFDTKYLKQQYKEHGNSAMFGGVDNYYYYYDNLNSLNRERGYGNVTATYKITDWLSAMARGGSDFYTEKRKSITQSGTANNVRRGMGGQFNQTNIFTRETNLDFILNFDKTFGNVRIDGLAGANYRDNIYNSTYLAASNLTVPDLYTISNVKGAPSTSMFDSEKRTNSVFAAANASYKDFLFVGVTGRNDWSSTLPASNRSYFYPSASVGLVITDAFHLKSDALSFAKIRASWAKVGGDTDPYQLSRTYSASSFNSISLFAPTGTLPPANLKPQETKSYEIGANVRFIKNRVSLDVTYYDQTTVNQIISVATSSTTGYTGMKLNAGEIENKGVEVMLNGKIFDNPSGFSWNIALNWAKNKNVVNELYGELQSYRISAGFGGAITLGIPGQDWGSIWGLPFVRDDKTGKMVVGDDGVPLTTNVAKNFGAVTPDWIGGINNSFRYKNLYLSFLIDMRKGGKFFSTTAWHSYPTGSYTVTTANNVRETGMVLDAVKEDGTPNDTRISAEQYYGGSWVWNNHEYSILDGTYIKLREVVLGYNINVKNIKWLKKLNLSVFGRNLAILYRDKSTAQFGLDPEVGMGGGDAGVGFENFQIPTTRNYGFKLSAGF